MVKKKIILVLTLYIILGVIAFFNFNFHSLLRDKVFGVENGVKGIEVESNGSTAEKSIEHSAETGNLSQSQD